MAPVNPGDTTFTVSPTVTMYAQQGFYIKITDGVNADKVGMVIAVDSVNGTITTDVGATHSFAPGSYVMLNVYVAKNLKIISPDKHAIGYGTMGGKAVPAGTNIQMVYKNNGGNYKTVSYHYEYTY